MALDHNSASDLVASWPWMEWLERAAAGKVGGQGGGGGAGAGAPDGDIRVASHAAKALLHLRASSPPGGAAEEQRAARGLFSLPAAGGGRGGSLGGRRAGGSYETRLAR